MRPEEDRARRYRNAYERVLRDASPDALREYEALDQEARQRGECMLCGNRMVRGREHRLIDEDSGTPAGAWFLAHDECFEQMHEPDGFVKVATVPEGVSETGGMETLTVFEQRDDQADVAILERGGGYVAVCRLCRFESLTFAEQKSAFEALFAHTDQRHPGMLVQGDFTRREATPEGQDDGP